MSKANAPDWAAVRRDYERGREAVLDLCARHGVSVGGLYKRVRGEGWLKRYGRPRLVRTASGRRAVLAGRLGRILEEQVSRIEESLARGAEGHSGEAAGEEERRLRALDTALRMLEKLTKLEEQARRNAPGEGKPERENFTEADAERLRRELSERFARLRSGDAQGVS